MAILDRKQVADVRPIDVETDVGQDITQPRIVAAEARAEATEAAEMDNVVETAEETETDELQVAEKPDEQEDEE